MPPATEIVAATATSFAASEEPMSPTVVCPGDSCALTFADSLGARGLCYLPAAKRRPDCGSDLRLSGAPDEASTI
jgi:hypothetical protein